ncbi:hypothetical protein SAMN02982989_3360 [Xaviernesmea oryzae]|uniref:Uncharacterized protein n=1 Tax=Xaviernesmea oryzae TaxID=464029 RepID=A0A1X7G8S3_9HYPH|nr:hypothetical protein [Xaviernesmea oryzae]SMF65458.1 hypothetical protein SAMN02982989_3360 [Xaviernesmea oryzae]
MKLKVTLEIEVADLPQDVREELADGLNFRADEDNSVADDLDTVPRLSEMSANDVTDLPYTFFEGIGDYEAQAEVWAGSDTYVYFSKVEIKDVMIVTEPETAA